jgi:hypothetical protein
MKRVPIPPPDADLETVWDFADRQHDHSHIKATGMDRFEWGRHVIDRYEATGELPEDQAQLMSMLSLAFRMIRFEVFGDDYDAAGNERLPMARAILAKLHALGVAGRSTNHP